MIRRMTPNPIRTSIISVKSYPAIGYVKPTPWIYVLNEKYMLYASRPTIGKMSGKIPIMINIRPKIAKPFPIISTPGCTKIIRKSTYLRYVFSRYHLSRIINNIILQKSGALRNSRSPPIAILFHQLSLIEYGRLFHKD